MPWLPWLLLLLTLFAGFEAAQGRELAPSVPPGARLGHISTNSFGDLTRPA